MTTQPTTAKPTIEQWIDIGVLAQQVGRHEEAERWYRAAYNLQPNHFDAVQLLGLVRIQQGDSDEGISLLRKALLIRPSESVVLHNLGQALRRTGRDEEGLELLRKAYQADSTDLQMILNLGLAEFERGAFSEAVQLYERATQIAPENSTVHLYSGLAYQQLNQPHQAIIAFARAIDVDPANGGAHFALGIAFSNVREFAAAAECFATALPMTGIEQTQHLMIAWGYAGLELGDWSVWPRVLDSINDQHIVPTSYADPFKTMHFPVSPDLLRHAATHHARDQRPFSLADAPMAKRTPSARIRVAYVSPDFSDHPVGRLIAPCLALHNRTQFEVHSYGWGSSHDSTRAQIVAASDHFTDVSTLSDAQIAARMRADGIDIAIDLAGYTADSRPRIFSTRAAPVQVSWLGYPGTLGTSETDYLISDVVTVDNREKQAITEAVIRLPHGFMAYDPTTRIAPTPGRAAFGLPVDAIVLACFAQIRKVNPMVFDLWMAILRELPTTVLWLPDYPEDVRSRLRMEAQIRSVAAERLIFATTTPDHSEYLARYAAVDIALDTFPYGSHSTALDALWTGTPLVALCGETVASRISASLLIACNLSDLVVNDFSQYQRQVIALASNAAALADVRRRIATALRNAAPFNPMQLTKQLEEAYVRMHHASLDGRTAESFDIR
jgi:predicted O-linked N-acetylglucosamine transferase (SPINDLY family)